MLKVNVNLFMPQHEYNTRLINLSNLNVLKVNKQFGKRNTIHVSIDLCRKLNIDLYKFKNKKNFNYIKKLNYLYIVYCKCIIN